MNLSPSLVPRRVLSTTVALVGLVLLLALAFCFNTLFASRNQQSQSIAERPEPFLSQQTASTPPLPTPGQPGLGVGVKVDENQKADEAIIIKAAVPFLVQRGFPMGAESVPSAVSKFPVDRFFEIERVRVDISSKQWATVTIVQRYRDSNLLVPTQPTFLLARKLNHSWQFALPNMSLFTVWLDEVPSSFISEEEKSTVRDVLNLK